MKLVLLGAPGAGKGTQAEILSKRLGIPCISTGEMLRVAVRNGTSIGQKVKELMDSGSLVPDDMIITIVSERVRLGDCRGGYIFDGMPRTIAQAEALEARGIAIETALSIETTDAEIEARMTGRRVCPKCGTTYHVESNPPKADGVCNTCGAALITRSDDEPETVRNRLATYHRETEPLKEYYKSRGKLISVASISGIEEMAAAVFSALGIDND